MQTSDVAFNKLSKIIAVVRMRGNLFLWWSFMNCNLG